MNDNINRILLNHLRSGGGAAGYMRKRIAGIVERAGSFFSARSDIQRIQKAEELAELILYPTGFSTLIRLRSEVATLEINRILSYEKQKDHTAHTVYLFLLGIWMYDTVPDLKKKIDKKINSINPEKMFLFQLIFASLLHDIGYLIHNYETGKSKQNYAKYDEMFDIYIHLKNIIESGEGKKNDLEKILDDFFNEYGVPKHTQYSDSMYLMNELNNIPWLGYISEKNADGFGILYSEWDEEKVLKDFAVKAIKEGYSENNCRDIDHAVAGGLMLLKYTSMWYWLNKKVLETDEQIHKKLYRYYRHPEKVFIKHVVPACRAVAYHNIPDVQFDFEKEPLIYLGILCDELQIWDRFWSGAGYISQWKNINHIMAEQILAETTYSEKTRSDQAHFMVTEELKEKLQTVLDSRLKNWRQFVRITSR